ncbi:MAG: hypothetical protein HQL28_05795, partial [Candidatus Omnitrophica bacterium]|nr:hypothetical protein [Candidatus Omnitrophota bacterium]
NYEKTAIDGLSEAKKTIEKRIGDRGELKKAIMAEKADSKAKILYEKFKASGKESDKKEWMLHAIAAYVFAFNVQTGFKLRQPQVLNAIMLSEAETMTDQGTGQGKTFSVGLALYMGTFS